MRNASIFVLLLFCGLCACAPLRRKNVPDNVSQPSGQVEWPGKRADGSVLLPNQWSLRPAGRQIELADFPVNIAVHPGGRFVAILHAGYSQHEILIVDLSSYKVLSHTPINEAFYGLEFSSDGRRLFCSGAGDEVIHQFHFDNGALSAHKELRLRPATGRGVPAGLALDQSGRFLYAANVWGHRVTQVALGTDYHVNDIGLGSEPPAPTPPGVKPSADFDTAAAEKRAEAALFAANASDTFPYACRLDERRHRLYVSLWSQASVAVIDLVSQNVIARWPTEEHPCEMALSRNGKLLFVANASRNTVTLFDTESGKAMETICSAFYPKAPAGSTPNSLALSPDERTLFIANADNNLIAVFDVSSPGRSRSLGFIPTGGILPPSG